MPEQLQGRSRFAVTILPKCLRGLPCYFARMAPQCPLRLTPHPGRGKRMSDNKQSRGIRKCVRWFAAVFANL